MTSPTAHTKTGKMSRAERKVLAGTLIGTTIEWYDFILYAQIAGFVFAGLYFDPWTEGSPGLGTVVALSTIGVSFLFRPLGAVIAGRLGDRIGRKRTLVLTLILMGLGTTLIGFLPTYDQIGVWAPLLLVFLRIVQGLSAGGEWGGAALLAVEHAPTHRRGFFGAYPQIGVPAGIILGTAVSLIFTTSLSDEQYLSWGWRVPFMFSAVLILVGYVLRRTMDESPVFAEIQLRKKESSAPLKQLFAGNSRQVVLASLIFVANSAVGYVLIGFLIAYAVRPAERLGLGMDKTSVLLASMFGYVTWLVFSLYGGWLSDRIGRVRTYQLGYALMAVWAVPAFMLIDTKSVVWFAVAVAILGVSLGLSYGPMSAMYAEMFPAEVRYSGVAIGNAFGAILGGAFAATISQLLLEWSGWSGSVGVYIVVLSVVSFSAVTIARETKGRNLGVDESARGITDAAHY